MFSFFPTADKKLDHSGLDAVGKSLWGVNDPKSAWLPRIHSYHNMFSKQNIQQMPAWNQEQEPKVNPKFNK